MNSAKPLQTLGTVCKRYGPGRLPGAERADIGAGYAGASAAFLAVLAWMVLTAIVEAVGPTSGLFGVNALTLSALALVVPVAFVAGVLVWRHLPTWTPHFGAVAGLLGTIGTYVGATLVLVVVFPFLTGGLSAPALGLGVRVALAYGIVGFVLTFPVTLPVGAASGAIYERVGTDAV